MATPSFGISTDISNAFLIRRHARNVVIHFGLPLLNSALNVGLSGANGRPMCGR